jgi:hypothetical protein
MRTKVGQEVIALLDGVTRRPLGEELSPTQLSRCWYRRVCPPTTMTRLTPLPREHVAKPDGHGSGEWGGATTGNHWLTQAAWPGWRSTPSMRHTTVTINVAQPRW